MNVTKKNFSKVEKGCLVFVAQKLCNILTHEVYLVIRVNLILYLLQQIALL